MLAAYAPEVATKALIDCPAGPVFRTFVQYLITFCSRPEAARDVIVGSFLEPIVVDMHVKLRGPS